LLFFLKAAPSKPRFLRVAVVYWDGIGYS
jgi:hypothetical protein